MKKLQAGLLGLFVLQACGSPKTAEVAAPSKPTEATVAAEPTPVEKPTTIELPGTTDSFETSMGTLVVAPIWHGTVAFAIGETVILVDPWSQAPSGSLPKADLILITDTHPDHLDAAAIANAKKEGTVVVGPAAVAAQLDGVVSLANGEQRNERGISITAVPMYNNTRGPEAGKLFHDKGRGNGYLLGFGDTTVYLSGDTECTNEMKALENIDLALVCMNLPYTMPPEEAAECIMAFQPKVIMPYHYRGSDLSVLAKALEGQAGIELRQREFYKAE